MIRPFTTLILGIIVCAGAAVAADQPIFVLRTAADTQQGIIRFDPESKTESRFADFLFRVGMGPKGNFALSATADRIIAQGEDYYEFDAGSGQLLRRYPAIASSYGAWGWAFHGTAVDPPMAARLGIPPGYYGVPVCIEGAGEPPFGCSNREAFPGYSSRSNYTEPHVFLRRGFDPADGSLTLVKLFSPGLVKLFSPGWRQRLSAIDPERRQFWFWFEPGSSDGTILQRLTRAPIGDGAVTDEIVVREVVWRPSDPVEERPRSAGSFAFDSGRDSFIALFYGPSQSLVRIPIDGPQEVLETFPAESRVYGITSLSAIEPETYTQLLPAVGDAPGVNGTYWRSDAWLFNPSGTPMDVTLRRVSRPETSMRITLAARASTRIENILRALGGGAAGDGTPTDAVILDSSWRAGAQLSVYSRTWTPAPSGGSYGQSVPAVPSLIGYSNFSVGGISETSSSPSVFALDKRDPQQFRHNIGVVNPSDAPVTVRLRYAEPTGNEISNPDVQKFLMVPPHSTRQYSIEALFPREVIERRPPTIWVMADRPAAVWLSMVDNRTGDASFIPFTHADLEVGPSSRLAFPAVAYTPGANGTFWRTDAYGIFNNQALDSARQSPDATFHLSAGQCANAVSPLALTPSPGSPNVSHWGPFWFHTFADLARQACPGSTDVRGALEVRTGSWMSAVSRTYTTREDGGTYGEILPLYPPLGWPSRHFSGIEVNPASRVNLGFYNGVDAETRTELRLYRADGQLAATKIIDLSARESVQMPLGQLFGIELPVGLYALSVLPLDGAGTWPYISTVDNITGDPTNWW